MIEPQIFLLTDNLHQVRKHQISGPTQEFYVDSIRKLNSITRENNYSLEGDKVSLSFSPYVRFSKFGYQSYMNTTSTISNF